MYFSFGDISNDLSELPIKLCNKRKGGWEGRGQTEGTVFSAALGDGPGPERVGNWFLSSSGQTPWVGRRGVHTSFWPLPRLTGVAGCLSSASRKRSVSLHALPVHPKSGEQPALECSNQNVQFSVEATWREKEGCLGDRGHLPSASVV